MSRLPEDFGALRSEEISLQGSLASDVRSLWRRLARTREVRDVARSLSSASDRIGALCEFVDSLVAQQHDPRYLHPDEMAVCAALVILEQSPLSVVRNLFWRLRREGRPSLVWVRRLADYCDERFVPCGRMTFSVGLRGESCRAASFPAESPGLEWAEAEMRDTRHTLSVA